MRHPCCLSKRPCKRVSSQTCQQDPRAAFVLYTIVTAALAYRSLDHDSLQYCQYNKNQHYFRIAYVCDGSDGRKEEAYDDQLEILARRRNKTKMAEYNKRVLEGRSKADEKVNQ
jgi:predicted GIY-YIG superfamily endonuclease